MTGFLLLLLLGATAWLIVKWTESRERITSLEARLTRLELQRMRAEPAPAPAATPVPIPVPLVRPPPVPQPQPTPVRVPIAPIIPTPVAAKPPTPQIHWEKFLGVKMFAWVGGFVLFLAVVFFVKYAFDKNLITPQMQVAVGYLT